MIEILRKACIHQSRIYITAALVVANLISFETNAQAHDKLPKNQPIQEHIDNGIRFGNEGNFEKAIGEFKQVLHIDPKNIHAYNNLGVAYFRLGDVDGAISSYSKAIDLGIADANMYFFRGLMYGKYKQEDAKAIKDYSKAIQLEPKNSRAYLNRALAYSFLKMHDKSIADYNKMVELRPDDLRLVLELRAQSYYAKGDYKMAWSDVDKSKELGVALDKEFMEKLTKAAPRKR
jgi:tetratricopeptide (TPR) repeat protein